MNEIEVKILEIDRKDIEDKLLSLGAKKVFEGEVVWVAFDFPDSRFSDNEMLVRLRKQGEQAELTVKKLLNTEKAKTSEEIEVKVSDYDAMAKILLALGLKQKRNYPLSKHRISYILDDVHFEIDTLPQIPTYLEIEGPNSQVIQEYAKKLGFSQKDIKPWGAREVFAHYRVAKR